MSTIPLSVDFGDDKGGLLTVGFTLYGPGPANLAQARTTTGVAEIGTNTGKYGVNATLPGGFTSGFVLWDSGEGTPIYSADVIEAPLLVDGAGQVTVGAYGTGQDPATLLLASPANKLATDASGQVTVASLAAGALPAVADAVLDELVSDHTAEGTAGHALQLARAGAIGREVVDEESDLLSLYDIDGTTHLGDLNLLPAGGPPWNEKAPA